MTPDLQGQRAMSPISGGSSPLTQRNRFPTSSGRASTAMALAGQNPPLEKTSQQRRPRSLVIYDIKPALGKSKGRKKKKLKLKRVCRQNGQKKRPGGFKCVAVSTRSNVRLFFSLHKKNRVTLHRITTAIHASVSPQGYVGIHRRGCVPPRRWYYFRSAAPVCEARARTPRTTSNCQNVSRSRRVKEIIVIIMNGALAGNTAVITAAVINNNNSYQASNARFCRNFKCWNLLACNSRFSLKHSKKLCVWKSQSKCMDLTFFYL